MTKRLVPEHLLGAFSEGQPSGEFPGLAAFIDVANFTKATRRHMSRGRRGAEEISRVIQATISPAVEAVEAAGGFVTSFSGDAFTAVFPWMGGEPGSPGLQRVESLLRRLIAEAESASEGPAAGMRLKAGLGGGSVRWTIVQHPGQSLYFYHGSAIHEAHRSCARCRPGEVTVDASAAFAARETDRRASEGGDAGLSGAIRGNPGQGAGEEGGARRLGQERFVDKALAISGVEGELRDVVCCMISFDPELDFLSDLPHFIDLALESEGCLHKFDTGDKGPMSLVVFGAPRAVERMPERAGEFLLSARNRFGRRIRAGMTVGTVFSGYVGSRSRCEYTVLGDVVNLAARLMEKAEWGELLCGSGADDCLPGFRVDAAGSIALKGYEEPVGALRLVGRRNAGEPEGERSRSLGRNAELERLGKRFDALERGEFAGVVYVAGEAGIGKSTLVAEAVRPECFGARARWLFLDCDQRFQKSFQPFKKCLKQLYSQRAGDSVEENRRRFESLHQEFAGLVAPRGIASAEMEGAAKHLAGFLDLPEATALAERLSEKERYDRSMEAVKMCFAAMAAMGPLVLVVEDLQWIDHDSRALLESLCRWSEPPALLVIATCRSRNPGTVAKIFAGEEVAQELIWLDALSREEAEFFLKDAARRSLAVDGVPDSVVDLIYERAGGNPFYMEEMWRYLVKRGAVNEPGLLDGEDLPVPLGINMLITARLDLLAKELRAAVDGAAVLGVEFSSLILSKMNQGRPLGVHLEEGESEGIWKQAAISEYLFSHMLVRETAYNMLLWDSLRQLHRAAALAYEEIFAGNLAPFLPELASHCEAAGEVEKAMVYLRKAGQAALSGYQNAAAAGFFQRWLVLAREAKLESVPGDEGFNRVDAFLSLGIARKNAGEWDAAAESFDAAASAAAVALDDRRLLAGLVNKGDILRFQGHYRKAMALRLRALELARRIGDDRSRATIYGAMGNIYLCQGNGGEALRFYRMQEELSREQEDLEGVSNAIGNIGIVHSRRGDLEGALSCYSEQLRLCEAAGNRRGMAYATGNMGLLFRKRRQFDKAEESFWRQLELARDMHDRQLTANAVGNLAAVAVDLGNLEAAWEGFHRQRAIAEDLGDQRAMAYAFGMLGLIAAKRGDREFAETCYRKKLELSERLDNVPGKEAALRGLDSLADAEWGEDPSGRGSG